MTDPSYTHATLVVDRSGSMSRTQGAATEAINGYLAEQAKLPGRMTVSLIQFDTDHETVHDFVDVTDVPAYELRPRGGTALLDAVGYAITETGEHLAALPDDQRPGNVLIAIVTDGEENASHEWTLAKLKAAITRQQGTYSWTFAFFGADLAAWQGDRLGIHHVSTYAATDVGTQSVYDSLTVGTSSLRSTGTYRAPGTP